MLPNHSHPPHSQPHRSLPRRLLLRLAARLQAAWIAKLPSDPADHEWETFDSRLQGLQRVRHRWRLAHDHRLRHVLPDLHREAHTALDDLARILALLQDRFDEVPSGEEEPSPGLSLDHWLAELQQIDDEFEERKVDWKASTLRVHTDPITLKDVSLGRFALVFAWNRVGQMAGSRCFDLIALDPNPARGKDEVPHPHIRDQELCAGDAAKPLNDAIREGRLADAFLLIRSVLTTYNPQSPYVSLDDWEGTPCGECGGTVDPDERNSCEACHTDLCDSCVCSCSVCSDYRCGSCLQRCDSCHDGCCPGCLETIEDRPLCPECVGTCAECAGRFPKEDLSDDTKLCSTCLEIPETEDDCHESPVPPLHPEEAPAPLPSLVAAA